MSRYTPEEEERFYRALDRELGPAVKEALEDERVVEIVLNPDGFVRVERLGRGFEAPTARFEPRAARALLKTIATMQGEVLDREHPILESVVPGYGARIEGIIEPASPDGPVFAIRKHAREVFTLDEYVAKGRMTPEHCAALRLAIANKWNIVAAGSTGTGKTTLLNALLLETDRAEPGVRCFILEDEREILTTSPFNVQLEKTPHVDLRKLVKTALRMRPDRIIVGETRDTEAEQIIAAWSTGHPGLSSVHAESPALALRRFEQLSRGGALGITASDVGRAVHVVAFLVKGATGPRVQEVVRVHGWTAAHGYETESMGGQERAA